MLADPECVTNPILQLDLGKAGITSIIWATGFAVDYSWLNVYYAFDENGRPQHQRGVSAEPRCLFHRFAVVVTPWVQVLSGACGMMPSILPTISQHSVNTFLIVMHHNVNPDHVIPDSQV